MTGCGRGETNEIGIGVTAGTLGDGVALDGNDPANHKARFAEQLTEEQRDELRAKIQKLKDQGASREEIRAEGRRCSMGGALDFPNVALVWVLV